MLMFNLRQLYTGEIMEVLSKVLLSVLHTWLGACVHRQEAGISTLNYVCIAIR